MPATGWRILGFGKHPEAVTAIQNQLRTTGLRATNFALADDPDGDRRLVAELQIDRLVAELQIDNYDGIAIGGFINGQDPHDSPATEATTLWFNRVLNLIHAHAPRAKIILVRNPGDALPAIERVLGPHRLQVNGLGTRARGRRRAQTTVPPATRNIALVAQPPSSACKR